jgi:hypothetical protein
MELLLHGQIPYVPSVSAVRQQRVLLLNCGQQPEPRHIRTVDDGTDMSGDGETAVPATGLASKSKLRNSSQGRLVG